MKTEPQEKSVRTLRVGEQVRHVLSEILQRGDVHDVRPLEQLTEIARHGATLRGCGG